VLRFSSPFCHIAKTRERDIARARMAELIKIILGILVSVHLTTRTEEETPINFAPPKEDCHNSKSIFKRAFTRFKAIKKE